MNKEFIYCLTSPSGKKYIGRTKNIKRRFNDYKKYKCKQQPKIYNALKKYKSENFIYEILEEVNECISEEKETYWIYFFDSVESGYNCVYGGMGIHFMTDDVKSKISKKLLGVKRSEEFKEKQRKRKKSKEFENMKGNGKGLLKKETIEKNRKRMKENNPMKKHFSEEELKSIKERSRKIAEVNVYEFTNIKTGKIVITNRLSDFIEENNLHKRSVFRVISGERNHHKNWKIKKLN